MLKTILSIAGKPGLYKLVSQGRNMLIVESLVEKKRTPADGSEKIITLGDIAMYTDAEARKAELMKDNEMNGLMFKMKDDPRITKVGKFIRKTSIFKGNLDAVCIVNGILLCEDQKLLVCLTDNDT